MDPTTISFAFIVLVLLALGTGYGYTREKTRWNNGICRETGKRWESFDRDSQGGRMYKSVGDNGTTYYCDVSYAIDRVAA